MKFLERVRAFLNKSTEKRDKEAINTLKNWYSERFESVSVQRNALFVITIFSIVAIVISVLLIRYVKTTRSIEPFVIEIERKTGVPTVVEPIGIKAYSADESVKRYFVMKYIRAREEYFFNQYDENMKIVKILSGDDVYWADYRPKFISSNQNSPFNLYGQNSYRTVSLKSIIFPTNTSAQVRIRMNVSGIISQQMDKICFLEFKFENLKMSEEERLINPLGFVVTLYRIEDERGS